MSSLYQTTCPCGSTQSYEQCCGQYIAGQMIAPTPEALMRSRYSAYTQANIDYIQATMRGKPAQGFDPIAAKQWAQNSRWISLQVINSSLDPNNCHRGFVEFIATYQYNNQTQQLHECSEFHCIDKRWYYVDGKADTNTATTKVGRNDLCPCGSGKKYKKCCAMIK